MTAETADRRWLSPAGLSRTPSPARPSLPGLGPSPIAVESVMMVKATSGEKGWEISFDEDEEEGEEEPGPDGVADEEQEVLEMSFDVTDSDTPSTVSTAFISILPPTTASTANFPLDIFPSPPRSDRQSPCEGHTNTLELGPGLGPDHLRSRYLASASASHGLRPLVCRRRGRRHSEPGPSSLRSSPFSLDQRRYTMSFGPAVLAPSSSSSCNQERFRRTERGAGARRMSVGSINRIDRGGGMLKYDLGHMDGARDILEALGLGDRWEDARPSDTFRAGYPQTHPVCEEEQKASATTHNELDERKDPTASCPKSPRQPSPRLPSTTATAPEPALHRPHAPLWPSSSPSLPSGPSSPTNFVASSPTLPPGRVLSGFSDLNYSTCSFSVDSHEYASYNSNNNNKAVSVSALTPAPALDCSPTLPLTGLPDVDKQSTPTPTASASASPPHASRQTQTPISINADSPSVIGSDTIIIVGTGGKDENKPVASVVDRDQPCSPSGDSRVPSSSRSSPPSTSAIDRSTPSNDNQRPLGRPAPLRLSSPAAEHAHPGISRANASTIEEGSASTIAPPLSTTSTTTIAPLPLASPVSIYSQRSLPPPSLSSEVVDSMPFTIVNRSEAEDWDQVDTHTSPSSIHPFHQQLKTPTGIVSSTPSTRSGATPRSETILTPSDAYIISPPPCYTGLSGQFNPRRGSKFTAISGSSGSSTYSSETSSLRHEKGFYHTAEKPDISTVFEEESSSSSFEAEHHHQHHEAQRAVPNATPKDPSGISNGINTTNRSAPSPQAAAAAAAPTHRHHQSQRSYSSSNGTTIPGHTQSLRYTNRPRKGTVSSVNSGTAQSVKSVHPFASAVVRPASPPPSKSASLGQLAGQLAAPAVVLAQSRSQPNLAELYKGSQSPTMQPPHQVNFVSEEDARDDEETCPVCCESLSFTFRLPGEKPHIVPECGHSLHEECFVTVYGEVPPEGSRRNLGVCGVCRQQMRISDGGDKGKRGKGSKLAMLMGQQTGNGRPSHIQSAPSIRSTSGRSIASAQPTVDPNGDDALESAVGMHINNSPRSVATEGAAPKVVVPAISVKSEFPSITRSRKNGKQVVTAMVTVQVPAAGERAKYPARSRVVETPRTIEEMPSPQLPPSPLSTTSHFIDAPMPKSAKSGHNAGSPITPEPFAHVVADLRNRVVDYKTSGLDQLGPLRLFDLLCVRKGALIREFHVYLFRDALICVAEEKKGGLRNIFSSSSSSRSNDSGVNAGRGVLRMKGRIYVRHVKKVIDSSVQGELSLTITMEDESMDSFILTFNDRSSHETWKSNLNRLIDETKGNAPMSGNSSSKIAKLMGAGVPLPKSASSKGYTPTSGHTNYGHGHSASGMSEFGDLASPSTTHSSETPATSGFSHQTSIGGPGDLAFVQPLAPMHTPVDLVVCLSLPAPTGGVNVPLKVRLMRQALAFTLALMGPRDRISLVACELGQKGTVRKTPLLNTTRPDSRRRLEAFVESLGSGRSDKDDFEVTVGPEEKQDVVTAVNVALDVILQRKSKNALTGMILISDTSDVIKRAQMDLVTARLDAANVPVHALGYGKSHDPSPLWMLSNHTHGTYTFVKEWYDLRDSMAGVIGGLMSIAITNMKLHLSCAENDFRITKVSGTVQAIISHDGKDVDIELRELRHGETREIMVELELGSGGENGESSSGSSEGDASQQQHTGQAGPGRSIRSNSRRGPPSVSTHCGGGGSSVNGLGLDMLSVNDSNALRDGVYEDGLIDEVPVTEVDCSFTDPAAGRSVSRLAHPVLLTLAVLPANSPPSSSHADPAIVRRRMELLASDMITRALLIASRKNFSHAARILRETKRIIETIADGLRGNIHTSGQARSKREVQTLLAIEGLNNVLGDTDALLDGLEEHKELFERDHRNYAAQQAIVLRAQKSWTTRTPSERTYCTHEIQSIIQLSGEYNARS